MQYQFILKSNVSDSNCLSHLELQQSKRLAAFHKMLLTLAIVLVCSSAGLSATFIVTKTADTNDGVCDTDCSLREAIAAANTDTGADVIRFDPNTFAVPQTILLNGTELSIADNSNLTIEGPGPNLLTIDGDMRGRILFVGERTTANVSGFRMIRGNGAGTHGGSGGAVRVSNFSNVRFSNIVATQSSATNQGGAIFVANSTLVISDSVISNSRGIECRWARHLPIQCHPDTYRCDRQR